MRVFFVQVTFGKGDQAFTCRASPNFELVEHADVYLKTAEAMKRFATAELSLWETRAQVGDAVTLRCGTHVQVWERACGQGAEQHVFPKEDKVHNWCLCGAYGPKERRAVVP